MKNILQKKITSLVPLVALVLFMASCAPAEKKDKTIQVSAKNTAPVVLDDVIITIKDRQVLAKIDSLFDGRISVTAGDHTLPWQIIDYDNDGQNDQLLIVDHFEAEEEKQYTIRRAGEDTAEFPKRTYAEISVKKGGEWKKVTKDNGNEQYEYRGGTFENVETLDVPEEHTDHSYYIRYEGPGWESDKVGYRFYLDWRNAVDIFGKKTSDMVLPEVGQDGFDAYHEMADWGMDVLKVGSSLGIGSLGYWDGEKAIRVEKTDNLKCEITLNGDLKSKITTDYTGWEIAGKKIDLTSYLSIHAGSRLTKEKAVLSEPLDNLCTGIVKHEDAQVIQSENGGKWSYLATFGKQSLSPDDDQLGMAIFYRTDDLLELTEDEHSHVVVLQPDDNKVKYYYGATWEQDADQIASLDEFKAYLDHTLERLNHPVEVELNQ